RSSAAEEGGSVHDALALALYEGEAHCTLAAGDGQLVIEDAAGGTAALRESCAQRLNADRGSVERELEPGSGKRRQPAEVVVHLHRRPRPVDPRLRLLDLAGVGRARLGLRL